MGVMPAASAARTMVAQLFPVHRHMLCIQYEEVEPRQGQQLRNRRVRQLHKGADGTFPILDLLFQKIFAHNNIPLIQNFLPSNIAKHVPHLSISQNRRFFWTNAKYPRFLFVRSDKTNRELLAFVKPF